MNEAIIEGLLQIIGTIIGALIAVGIFNEFESFEGWW